MSTITADLFVSADGYAGGEGVGAYFGFGGPELEAWIAAELALPQVVLLGRRTYEIFARMSARGTDQHPDRLTALPKVVVSRTLTEPLTWPNSRLLRNFPTDPASLKQTSQVPLRTMGSLTLVRGLLAEGLLDRLRLMVFPLALGDAGREPIWSGIPHTALGSVEVAVLDERVTLLTYSLDAAGRQE